MNRLNDILTPKEMERARMVAEGYTNREIADRQRVSHEVVKHKMKLIYEKCGIDCVHTAARVALAIRYDRENYR